MKPYKALNYYNPETIEKSSFNPSQSIRDENVEDIKSIRMNNQTYFLGITQHGYQRPILEAINPRFKDPVKGGPKLRVFEDDFEKTAENFRNIDMDSGLVDGQNYGKFHRLRAQKKRHARVPFGPEQKFCIPVADSMNIGWWTRDMEDLNQTKWYAVKGQKGSKKYSDVTRFCFDMCKHDPNFLPF